MKLKIIHIIIDDKFSIPMVKKFMSDPRLENRAIYITDKLNAFKYLNDAPFVELVKPSHIDTLLRTEEYDVVYFHTLKMSIWKHLLTVPEKKTVIWWMFGFDFYELRYGVSPFVKARLFKEKTLSLLKHRRNVIIYWAKYIHNHINICKRLYYTWLKQKVIARIDYFNPVLPYEYEAMKQYPSFKAQLFYYKRTFPDYTYRFSKIENGTIILGNSATYTNNHADVISKLDSLPVLNNSVFVPLSYGDGGTIYVRQIKSLIERSKQHFRVLTDFIPREEYFSILSEAPYMISGVLRQQSMANIHFALRNAVKIFFFRDSDVYKYLASKGYIVFAIEDIDEHSFRHSLTYEEGLYNYNLNKKEIGELNKSFDLTVDYLLKRKGENNQ